MKKTTGPSVAAIMGKLFPRKKRTKKHRAKKRTKKRHPKRRRANKRRRR